MPTEQPARRRKRRPAGSRWLNRLLALGCLASLLPLYYEYTRGHDTRDDMLPPPPRDDPWVRVIDASTPARTKGNARTEWSHHPRHRLRADVRTNGRIEFATDDAATSLGGDAATGWEAMLQQEAAGSRVLRSFETMQREQKAAAIARGDGDDASSSHLSALPAGKAPYGATPAGEPPAAAASRAPTGAPTAPPNAPPTAAPLDRAEARRAPDADADASDVHFLRDADRAAVPARDSFGAPRARNASASSAVPIGRGGAARMWRTVPGGVSDVVVGEGANRTVFSVFDVRAIMRSSRGNHMSITW